MCKETCRRKFRHQRRERLEVAANSKPEDKMEDLDVNTLILGMLIIVTQAAVLLGFDFLDKLHSTRNQPQRQRNNVSM